MITRWEKLIERLQENCRANCQFARLVYALLNVTSTIGLRLVSS